MKPKRLRCVNPENSPDIPEGYREMEVGDIIQEDDMYWAGGSGPWAAYSERAPERIGYPVRESTFPAVSPRWATIQAELTEELA